MFKGTMTKNWHYYKQEMSLKKTNGVGLKKEKKYLYITLTLFQYKTL